MLNMVIRGIAALLIGFVVIVYRDAFLPLVVQMAGVLFLVSGMVSAYSIFLQYKQGLASVYLSFAYAVVAVCGLVLGMWLLLNPLFFVGIFMMLFGAVLIFMGLYQMIVLFSVKKQLPIRYYMFIAPLLLLVAGLLVVINPFTVAAVPFIIVGAGAVVSGIHDLLTAALLYIGSRSVKSVEKSAANDAE